jgi:predicted transcriptional regulator
MEELIKLLNKRGLYNTFNVLSLFNNYRADKHSFYQKLNEFSHYNSFLRIKNELLEKKLLLINNHNKASYYELTSKGKRMLSLIKELNKLIQ